MSFMDMREWIALLEKEGELRRIAAEVDWDREIGAIARRVLEKNGPALLFENIKGYRGGRCTRLFVGGLGVVIFFLATAYLLGREYFELAAMRHHPVAEAKQLRKMRSGTVFVAGMFIAAFVSIPIVNLATPLFAMAFMVHMYKRMTTDQRRITDQR